jgi:hypothetical protein
MASHAQLPGSRPHLGRVSRQIDEPFAAETGHARF